MYFTKNDIKQLLDVLKLNSKKDTEFSVASDLKGDENIALIQKGENKISTLNHLSSFVLKDITYDLNTEKTARENADKAHDESLKTLQTEVNNQVKQILTISTNLINVNKSITNHDTQFIQINTDMKQMDDNILRHGEEIENLQDVDKVFNNKITTLQTKVQEVINVNNKQSNAITSQGNRITETENNINKHTTQLTILFANFTSMQQTIQDLTTRIEALEKGSSADVENGILKL